MTEPREDAFAGCLVGQALGDALGFVVEGYPPAACRAYVDDYLRAGRAGEIGRGPFPFGQYTDDTQLARELVESYVEAGRFDPAAFARRVAAIFTENRIVGRGRATEEAAMRLAGGVPWDEAGTPAPSAGNGGAMRAGPVGLMIPDDVDAMVRAADDQARVTHADPRSRAGAVAVAGAAALGAGGRAVEAGPFVETLCSWCARVDRGFAEVLSNLADWAVLDPDAAAEAIAPAGLPEGRRPDWPGISPFVVPSVIWALYGFLRTPGDYWETILTAIAVGGDVDTTAAMAGAISGAHNGLDAVPADLSARLTDRGRWGREDLIDLARRAARLAPGG